MTWRLAGSLVTLRDQLNTTYPNRSKASDGTIGDAAHAASVSDHNPNSAGVVTAFDITHDPDSGVDIDKLSDALAESRDPRIKYLIANGLILVPQDSGWNWVTYAGADPHTSHLHISVYGDYDNKREWNIGENMQKITRDQVLWHYRLISGEEPSKQELDSYTGKDYFQATEEIKQYFANKGRGYQEYKTFADKRIKELEAALKSSGKPTNVTVLKQGLYEVKESTEGGK